LILLFIAMFLELTLLSLSARAFTCISCGVFLEFWQCRRQCCCVSLTGSWVFVFESWLQLVATN